MLVIGNGESRIDLDLNSYKNTKVGCNAIHRDHYVHHLVCCDRRMVLEAQEKLNYGKIYTRPDWKDQFKSCGLVPPLPYKGETRPDNPWHWGSGPYALLLGAYLSENTVHIIGFDIGSETDKVNNIYKKHTKL